MNTESSTIRAVTRFGLLALLVFSLAGCNGLRLRFRGAPPPELVELGLCDPQIDECPDIQKPDADTIRPQYRKSTEPVGEGFVEGTDADALDQSSSSELAEALDSAETSGERELGTTIASLGDVSLQGFWLKTPLVVNQREGRLVWPTTGASVNVTLMPKQGEASSGSQISLAAMRALEIPLTKLPELVVYAK